MLFRSSEDSGNQYVRDARRVMWRSLLWMLCVICPAVVVTWLLRFEWGVDLVNAMIGLSGIAASVVLGIPMYKDIVLFAARQRHLSDLVHNKPTDPGLLPGYMQDYALTAQGYDAKMGALVNSQKGLLLFGFGLLFYAGGLLAVDTISTLFVECVTPCTSG